MKFTQTNVAAIRPPVGKTDFTIWDEAMPRFGIRFRNGGAGSYVVQFSLNGKEAKLGLGKVSQVRLADAKTEAQQHFAHIAKKVDPRLERKETVAKSSNSVGSLVPRFIKWLEDAGRSKTYLDENRRSLERYFKALHSYGVAQVKRAHVATELSRISSERGKVASARSRAHLSKFFNWVIGEGMGGDFNPVSGTNKHQAQQRDRVLTPKEIVAIWSNLDDANDYDVINKILILTGARRDQIGKLKRSEVKRNERVIELVGTGRSKHKKKFLLPISSQVSFLLTMIWSRREDGTGFLFGRSGQKGGFSGWSKCKERQDERLGDNVDEWVLHDYRRTFDTLGQDTLKIPEHIADACLNHKGIAKSGVKGVYNHATYLDEKHHALQKWADYVDGLVRPKAKLRIVRERS